MGAATAFAVTADADYWAALPVEVRAAMREATPIYRDELARQSAAGDATGRQACVEQGGELITLANEERAAWAESLPPLGKEWQEAVESEGLPGGAVLTRYMDLLREADQPIARDWDRE